MRRETTYAYLVTRLNKSESYVPSAHQFVVLLDPGLDIFRRLNRAASNFHVMASLCRPQGMLKPRTDLFLDGDAAICASTAISTPRHRMFDGDEPLTLTHEQDPKGVVMNYLIQRDHVVLEDNQVDVFIASREERYVTTDHALDCYTHEAQGLASTSSTAAPAGRSCGKVRLSAPKSVSA